MLITYLHNNDNSENHWVITDKTRLSTNPLLQFLEPFITKSLAFCIGMQCFIFIIYPKRKNIKIVYK